MPPERFGHLAGSVFLGSCMGLLLPGSASAQSPPPAPSLSALDTVDGDGCPQERPRHGNLRSAGSITNEQVQEQPTLRPAEILQLVPGLVVVQHAAGGKANQYYLRGFEMDHGDMFSTWVDGVPVNEVSHVHGPGYTDLNWMIRNSSIISISRRAPITPIAAISPMRAAPTSIWSSPCPRPSSRRRSAMTAMRGSSAPPRWRSGRER